jgi:hypothetical protein
LSRIDSRIEPKNKRKKQENQFSINQRLNDEIKKIKDKKITIKRIKTSIEKTN